MNLASCIILYYPNLHEVKKNILSYIESVDKLYIIDNTPILNPETKELLKLSTKIEYIANYENLGIAKALNQACGIAISDSFDWIITFDQDSWCYPNTLDCLKNIAFKNTNIGSISPTFLPNEEYLQVINKWNTNKGLKEVECVITSGSLTNLNAYKKVNGFDESFFIDLVDTDFSFKLREAGFKVLQTDEAYILHSLGDSKFFKLWEDALIWYSNHSPIRRYYITRNRLYFFKRYNTKFPQFCNNEAKKNIKEIVKIFLFEENKIAKLKAIFYGFLDYYRGISGKTNREF